MNNELRQKLDLVIKKAVIHEIPIVFIDGYKNVSYTLPWIKDLIESERLIGTWESILAANRNDELISAWEIIGEVCKPVTGFEENQFFQQLRYPEEPGVYCALGKTTSQFPWVEINATINQSLVNKRLIPIHACGVMKKDSLFIFGGPSGIGKSTIGKLSLERGGKILDEDQLILKSIGMEKFSADAWGYSLLDCTLPIKAVFIISKSSKNRLYPLTKAQTTKFLFQQILEIVGRTSSSNIINAIFRFSSDIAHSIPGYHLNFSKSPDFWDLIDGELGLD